MKISSRCCGCQRRLDVDEMDCLGACPFDGCTGYLQPEIEEKIKYLVVPGYIYSKTDHDRHFITAERLIDLYCVKREECVVLKDENTRLFTDRGVPLIQLKPRYNGDYPVFTREANR